MTSCTNCSYLISIFIPLNVDNVGDSLIFLFTLFLPLALFHWMSIILGTVFIYFYLSLKKKSKLFLFSCKGVNRKTNNVTKEKYMDVLLTKQSGSGTNRGFRTIDNQVYTYRKELGSPTSTQNGKSWQMGPLQLH